ncbi:unnamed protein product [Caenorhabditis auriculariae]|uniref:Uncharacterized protein n=1 Tax=Caenorhabditis auriculariae TaxID=2777116 RepID=A0A8S1HND5_9PELO|nr:unnamed protein product [Caenorhabditis auriculariae]
MTSELRKFIAPLLTSLIELLLQPKEKNVDAKICIYRTMRLLLRNVFENIQTDSSIDSVGWVLDGKRESGAAADAVVNSVESMSEDVARHLATSITDFPPLRKTIPILLASDLLHEDLKGSKRLSSTMSKCGIPRLLCELLVSVDFDWSEVATARTQNLQRRECLGQYHLLTSVLISFARFAKTEHGWNALSELSLVEIISQLPIFTKPPKQVFIEPATVKKPGTSAHIYATTLDLALHVCKQMCTNTKWKKQSEKILCVIRSLRELLQQLIRANIQCEILTSAQELIKEISINDEAVAAEVEADESLQQLMDFDTKSTRSAQPINVNSSFAAPRQLFSTLIPA